MRLHPPFVLVSRDISHARVLHDAAPKSFGWISTCWKSKWFPFRVNLKYNFIPGEKTIVCASDGKTPEE
jgi:hypothetical protein